MDFNAKMMIIAQFLNISIYIINYYYFYQNYKRRMLGLQFIFFQILNFQSNLDFYKIINN